MGRLAFILLPLVVLICSYNLAYFYSFQVYLWLIFLSFPFSFIWFISCLSETNRTPFDFAEGKSEFVSGFNIEYGGGGFALIFLAEYASILFISLLFCIIFLGSDLYYFLFYFKLSFVSWNENGSMKFILLPQYQI